MPNDSVAITESRAIVVVDMVGFSEACHFIDAMFGAPELVMIYQDKMETFCNEILESLKLDGTPRLYAGGDSGIFLFKEASGAHAFMMELHLKSHRHNENTNAPQKLLFRTGAHYGKVCLKARGESSIHRMAGYPISIACRLQAASDPGQCWATKEFVEQLTVEEQKDYSCNFDYVVKKTRISGIKINQVISQEDTCTPTTIELKDGSLYQASDWPILWNILMTGQLFWTINYQHPDAWKESPYSELGLITLGKLPYLFSRHKLDFRRLFVVAQNEDFTTKYAEIIDRHTTHAPNIDLRYIPEITYKQTMLKLAEINPVVKDIPKAFSITRLLDRCNRCDHTVVAKYDYDDDRKMKSILIKRPFGDLRNAYYRAYEALWDIATPCVIEA